MDTQEWLSQSGSLFENFSADDTNAIEGVRASHGAVNPEILVDVWDSETVTDVWADFKRSNESEWVSVSMEHVPLQGDHCFRVSLSLSVSQTITYFDVRFRANDTASDVSTSQDFSFVVYYSQADTPPYDVVALNRLVRAIVIVAGSVTAIAVVVYCVMKRTNAQPTTKAGG